MIVLGITGTLDRVDELVFKAGIHDSSAALVKDGEVVAAVEEERFNRYKHSGKLPVQAIRYCLGQAGIELTEVDKLVFNIGEAYVDKSLEVAYSNNLVDGYSLARPFIQQRLSQEFGCSVDPRRFEFIDHHYSHAVSAFLPSGFEESLVVTLDGMGAGLSGSVWKGEGNQLFPITSYDGRTRPTTQSLGHLYIAVTVFLGFRQFDEFKVMGLAPYGRRERYRWAFDQLYSLKARGGYEIYLSRLEILEDICRKRQPDDAIEQVHKDLAAALQESLERLVFHILQHHQAATGARRLCLAGGVAHNCAVNGEILKQGLFDEAFVQPASHDGGLSLGAALHGSACNGEGVSPRIHAMKHAFLGPAISEEGDIERELSLWDDYLDYERSDRLAESVAEMISQGTIVGWVQGRAEFGPRALGNRSIVADPRPADNKDIINAMIKKREAFRPFAPSVLEEDAEEFFELPPYQKRFPFMVFVVKVREEYRDILGAITHVDGTARIQTVDRESNPRYWDLIAAFGRRTGLPILLNTSFNNNAEPIVNSARDALVCYLTTGLHRLVIGDCIIRRKEAGKQTFGELLVSLPAYVKIHSRELRGEHVRRPYGDDTPFFRELFDSLYAPGDDLAYCLGNTHDRRETEISAQMASLLARADGYRSLNELVEEFEEPQRERLLDEGLTLWGRRQIRLLPEVWHPGPRRSRSQDSRPSNVLASVHAAD